MFDFRRFLEDSFQTPVALLAFLNAYGVQPPTYGAINKWFTRETIPADWFAIIVALLEFDSGPVKLAQYLTLTKR